MSRRLLPTLAAALLAASCATAAQAQSAPSAWASLASDRSAASVGDALTVVIVEASSAASSAQSGTRRDTRIAGSITAGGQVTESGALGLQGGFDGRGQQSRSGRLIGQISVTVQEILPGGDLRIAGDQTIMVDGERTAIELTGRVRPADIQSDNTVLSSRIADARITYDGEGAIWRGGRPSLLNGFLSWFGL